MMGFLALILTLAIEQLRPLPARSLLSAAAEAVADGAEAQLNAGRRRHGLFAWMLVVPGLALLSGAAYLLALQFSVFAALAVNVIVLYMTLGFRQFSHPITQIQKLLAAGNAVAARDRLGDWLRIEDPTVDISEWPLEEVVRVTMERGVLLSHRHVFGVFFWFVVLPGPTGPVLYRVSEYVARRWNRAPPPGRAQDRFGDYAQRAFAWIDWLPVRLTALGFAVVGDFEGTLHAWRAVRRKPDPGSLPSLDSRSLLLMTASGALGTRVFAESETALLLDEGAVDPASFAEPD
ncbi:MAG: regulatory signaling modulator protein AmpE, partial [Betaproteobacteria bacterium]